MFRALSVRNYRLYFTGQVLSNTGTWMQRVAQDWLVLDLSGTSGVALGITTGLQFLPYLFFSLWGGTLADRFERRRMLVWTQGAMGLLALALGVHGEHLRVDLHALAEGPLIPRRERRVDVVVDLVGLHAARRLANGYGGFTGDGRTYAIVLDGEMRLGLGRRGLLQGADGISARKNLFRA